MNTQRVEGHTPVAFKYIHETGRTHLTETRDVEHARYGYTETAFYSAADIERLEKVNEALMSVAEQLARWITAQGYPLPKELESALKLAKEPA